MLKSTEMKIMQLSQLNSTLDRNNQIKKEKLEIEKEKLEFEKETKNRVDISLKELEELKQKNKDLEKENEILKELNRKIFKPFIANKVPERIINKLLNGDFETKIRVFEDVASLETTVDLVFKVAMEDLVLWD